ncbi:UdgX family uracil-DNA binding protein [Xanthomonas theicola]|uniref:UdgX family uracil-DNA binding protein n=1 Tax=Xanthomonas theicola TaxID=56464 RepID=UPI001FEC1F52|nr:UdgX family uracil-DNA binding protein [Xanthomonas theicola]
MPQTYWKNLPGTRLLPGLIRDAGQRVREMAERVQEPLRRLIPAPSPPAAIASKRCAPPRATAAAACGGPATQTVFGEGPHDAAVMVVGEQPGDEEDRPFVGPAGRLFDRALDELGIARAGLYVTNAVKHFRFEQRGKVRLHRNPERTQVAARRFWLAAGLARVRPRVVLCLGATAARAVLGNGFALMAQRGQWRTLVDGARAMATVHPSWLLRQRGNQAGEAAYRGFVDDLRALAMAAETPCSADAEQRR